MPLKKRINMKKTTASLLAISSLLSLSAKERVEKKQPNILFIIVDDLRPELGCYGHPYVQSPNIDRLASEGMMFQKAYCNVPVSGASRASLLTGMRPTTERFTNYDARADRDVPDVPTLPEHFKKNGYTTLSLGKVFHHMDDSPESWSRKAYRPDDKPGLRWRNYITEENQELSKNKKHIANSREFPDVDDDAYFDGEIANEAIAQLKQLDKSDKPFFMSVGFLKPHLPFNAPAKYKKIYDDMDITIPYNYFIPKGAPKASLHNFYELRAYLDIPNQGVLDTLLAEDLIRSYYACVSYADYAVGKVLDELDQLGLRENTIVILIGDHGWNLGEHLLWAKHAHYNTSIHAPMIISVPGMDSGKTESISEFVDIYPTLCDLSSIDLPSHLQGTSLKPILNDPKAKVKDYAYVIYQTGKTVISKDFIYTEFKTKKNQDLGSMLYDMNKDPDQNVNVVDEEEYRDTVKNLKVLLK